MKQCTKGTYGFRFYQAVSRVIFDTDLVATRLILALAEIFWVVMLAWPSLLATLAIDTPAKSSSDACVCLRPCTVMVGIFAALHRRSRMSMTVEL